MTYAYKQCVLHVCNTTSCNVHYFSLDSVNMTGATKATKTSDKKTKAAKGATKGGSQASTAVNDFVSTAAFNKMHAMFSNTLSLASGGSCRSCRRRFTNVDVNEKLTQNMTVFNKNGGKPKKAAKTAKTAKTTKATKQTKGSKGVKRGGAADTVQPSDPSVATIGYSDLLGFGINPPTQIAAPSVSHADLSSIPQSQLSLASQRITSPPPIVKNTQFPNVPAYKGSFQFGGAKGKRTKK